MSTVARLRSRALAIASAATTPQGLDGYVGLVAPTWSAQEVQARIVEVLRTTPDSVTLRLRPNARWTGYVAGQHTQVTVEIDGVRHTRCYSLAGSQHDRGPLELTLRAHPGGTVSQHLFHHAAVGDVVHLTPARGDFVLPAERPERVLLVSGGSGITPVLSMLRTLVDEGHPGPVTFLHYALTADRMLYRRELEQLAAAHPNVRLVRVLTDEPGAGDLDGFLTEAHLDAADPDWRTAEAYVCGPAPLMDATAGCFAAAGRADHLHREAFTLGQLVAEAGTTGGTLHFACSGSTVVDDGRPILDQAEAAGLRPQSGCRMGICHTCIRPLRAGTVRNVLTGDLHHVAPDAAGDVVQLCVNVPVGDIEIDL